MTASPQRPSSAARLSVGSIQSLETVKENRILKTDGPRREELPFTPRQFQQIKASCLKMQEEIDAQLRALKPRPQRLLSDAAATKPSLAAFLRRPRTPKVGTLQDRLRLKIARCRSQPELLTAQNPKGLGQRSVALEIERELGKGPLKAEDLSRFLSKREHQEEKKRSRPSSASSVRNFVQHNRKSCLDFMAQREVQLEMQNLRRCVRTDLAKKKRLADLEAMHQAAAEDYWTRFFHEASVSHHSRNQAQEGPLEDEGLELSEEERVKKALDNLAKYMPSKVMKLFTRLFDYEQLCEIFSGNIVDHMAMACRLYGLVRRLIHWSRVWKMHKAADVLHGLLKIPPPLGFRIKMPMQKYWGRLRKLQRTWRRFRWRLKSLTKHIYQKMWFRQENEFLEDVFLFCPGNNATVVSCPEMLGESPDTYNLPSKNHRKSSTPMVFTGTKPKRGGLGTEDMMKKLLQDAFSHRKREHQFRPEVAKSIITRELLERLYLHAQRLPVGVNRAKELRRSRSGITYGFPSSVVLRAKDVDELICSAHQACGVKPALEERCDHILPCPPWRVKAMRSLLLDHRSLRQGLLDRRYAEKETRKTSAASSDDRDASASEHAEQEEGQSEAASSRDGTASAGRKRHAVATTTAPTMAAPTDVGTMTGAMLALQLFQSRQGRRQSQGGTSEEISSESSVQSFQPEDVVDAALVYDREAFLQSNEDLPSQRPSVHLATNEAGWPSSWRLEGSFEAMLQD